MFYFRKKEARKRSQQTTDTESIAMDFQKNLTLPNITTNDVYYSRQLSFYSFNIHTLSTNEAVFYCYDETTGRKGSAEVVSFLHHFIYNLLRSEVRHLEIFCDSCCGQNKNYSMLQYYIM